MKKIILSFLFLLIPLLGFNQEKLNLPGDNFNLYGTLKVFQESKTLEEFEKNINDPKNHINNLDLNVDYKTDYIKIIDTKDGNTHIITLRDVMGPGENQDIATIIVERQSDKVDIQIIGNELMYGENYVIEPNISENKTEETPNPGYVGSVTNINYYSYNDIYNWEIINYIYAPYYNPWISPYYWGFYPLYWHSWSPYPWYRYHRYHYNHSHYNYYRHVRSVRYPQYHTYYRHVRSTSENYKTRLERGEYKKSYSSGNKVYSKSSQGYNPENRQTTKRQTDTYQQPTNADYRQSQRTNTQRSTTPTPTQRSSPQSTPNKRR